jgi:hypothetical protein
VGPERTFRVNRVIPFLKTLKNSYFFAIQQKAINGDPDFVGVSCGLFIGLELKAPGEKPEPLQEWKGSEIRRAGGLYIVASHDNWGEVKSLLKLIDRGQYDQDHQRIRPVAQPQHGYSE